MIKPERFDSWDYQPKIVITDASVNNNPYRINQKTIKLSNNERDLSLEFAALDFSGPEQLRYKYIVSIEGNDANTHMLHYGFEVVVLRLLFSPDFPELSDYLIEFKVQ